jgi:adsorption protein B
MVQFPVFPLPAPAGQHVHWVSADEFAELHTRELPARQALNGFVPSAGVGTAFNRWVLQFAGTSYARNLFSHRSLTEDYDLALRLALGGAKLAFLERPFGRAIATRALFPRSFAAAVRQRTRWLIGICLQAWRMHGWHGGAWFRFMLFRDRKAIADNLLAGVSYILLIYLGAYGLAAVGGNHAVLHQPVVESGTALWYLVIADTLLMLWRGLQRAVFVRRVYGGAAAALSVPRLVLATVINCCAAIRAIGQAVSFGLAQRRIPWEKTSHEFPEADHPRAG